MDVEQLHQLGKIRQGAGEPIDLADDNNIHLPRPDVGEQALQIGTVEGTSGDPAIVIAIGQKPSALVQLTLYICLAGLPLGVEGIELQIQIMFGGFAGILGRLGGVSVPNQQSNRNILRGLGAKVPPNRSKGRRILGLKRKTFGAQSSHY
jgi:hypothetical protein